MSFLISLEQDAEATVLAAAKTALANIEGLIITDVQEDVVPALIAFLENTASKTITYLGGFLSKVVGEITGAAPAVPTVVPPAS